ncbi:MAG: di-heme oxidoredictase family protein [Leptolyngbyaceae cyanobacterium bins.349]|nr:di-heme oxidoredictase family protein [Leptolyngbyaceae cyanobacterium bins.349]
MKFFRSLILVLSLLVLVGVLGYQAEIALPGTPPALSRTLTPSTKLAPDQIGAFDVLGRVVDAEQSARLLQTEAGQQQLAAENGAVEITQDLIDIGRNAFYTETFGNEVFITDVTGALDGVITLPKLVQAIAFLGGKATTNLQIPLNEDVVVGGQKFQAGDVLNTGLDVPARSLLPLGMKTFINHGQVKVGITCAACHATVDPASGKIIEGAPNTDLDTGLILAMASNSAAWFRQTGVNPLSLPPGDRTYIDPKGREIALPDAKAMEDAVDADLLTWPPGNFDSTGDIRNNPSQNPSSYTHEAYPYGWNGFASIGWFHGLTTLNSNVHAVNSDLTTGGDASKPMYGIEKDMYLGTILQNSANAKFRLPEAANPTQFLDSVDPTPGTPGLNQVTPMPGYPRGSLFILDGLIAGSPGTAFGEQLNGMSAYQNTLAPPPNQQVNQDSVQRGAKIFANAGCAACHSGRYFTNHDVIAQQEIKTQPSRGKALITFNLIFKSPQTYPSSVSIPLPPDPPVLDVPKDITPEKVINLAYGRGNLAGGFKVPSLIGLHVTAPYLHDGGVAASKEALKPNEGGYYEVADVNQLGLVGTHLRGIAPDPEASLRVLVDRTLRQPAIAMNRADATLQQSNVEGIGHEYWVDQKAGFSGQDQTDLIQFLLSLDDEPTVLPLEVAQAVDDS